MHTHTSNMNTHILGKSQHRDQLIHANTHQVSAADGSQRMSKHNFGDNLDVAEYQHTHITVSVHTDRTLTEVYTVLCHRFSDVHSISG